MSPMYCIASKWNDLPGNCYQRWYVQTASSTSAHHLIPHRWLRLFRILTRTLSFLAVFLCRIYDFNRVVLVEFSVSLLHFLFSFSLLFGVRLSCAWTHIFSWWRSFSGISHHMLSLSFSLYRYLPCTRPAHILARFFSRFFSSLRRSLIDSHQSYSPSRKETRIKESVTIINALTMSRTSDPEMSKSSHFLTWLTSVMTHGLPISGRTKHVMVALLTPHPQQLNTLIIFMGRSPKPSTLWVSWVSHVPW